MMKTCTKCGEKKELTRFWTKNTNKDNLSSECKDCQKKRYLELKSNPIKQIEKALKSSIIIENRLLFKQGKKMCYHCKQIFNINELLINGICKSCKLKKSKEQRSKDKNKEYQKEYQKEYKKMYAKTDKSKEYQKEYRLKKKLEKENKATS